MLYSETVLRLDQMSLVPRIPWDSFLHSRCIHYTRAISVSISTLSDVFENTRLFFSFQ